MIIHKFHISGEYPGYPHHPDEDYAVYQDNKFAVFDGVTLLHQEPYPIPSPAADAARLACEVVMSSRFRAESPEQTLRLAAKKANNAIRRLNEAAGVNPDTIDYLKKQYAAAVGAFGFIENGQLYGTQINDAEIAVLDSSGNIKFRLETDTGPIGELLESGRAKGDFKANSADEHAFARREIINNPQLDFQGRRIWAGVLTGEKIALDFLNIGSTALSSGDTVLFYTDGLIPYIETPEFRAYLAGNDLSDFEARQQTVEAERRERTLIVVKEPA
jgi:hypothetical protein